jgi:hypothetical protein
MDEEEIVELVKKDIESRKPKLMKPFKCYICGFHVSADEDDPKRRKGCKMRIWTGNKRETVDICQRCYDRHLYDQDYDRCVAEGKVNIHNKIYKERKERGEFK